MGLLSADLRAEARRMERCTYPQRMQQRTELTGARAARREARRQRQDRERERQQWSARLRDREPRSEGKRTREECS